MTSDLTRSLDASITVCFDSTCLSMTSSSHFRWCLAPPDMKSSPWSSAANFGRQKKSRQSVHRNVVYHTGGKPTRVTDRLFRFPRQHQRIGSAKFDVHQSCCRDILECNNTSMLNFLIARADDLILTVSNPCSSASCPECYPTHVLRRCLRMFKC